MPSWSCPPASFPTVYADGVLNVAPGPYTVKFYLLRLDPAFDGNPEARAQPFLQIAMPTISFVQMVVFFEKALADLVKQGVVAQSMVDEVRKALG